MHQSHKAVKATGLLAAHRDSACRWDREPLKKKQTKKTIKRTFSFRYNLAVCLIMQHCVLLMQKMHLFVLQVMVATRGELQHLESRSLSSLLRVPE